MDLERAVDEALLEAFDALGQMWPDLKLERSLDTLLIGEGAVLDSTTFLAFLVAAEQGIEAGLGEEVSIMDILDQQSLDRLTVADLAGRISATIRAGQQVAG